MVFRGVTRALMAPRAARLFAAPPALVAARSLCAAAGGALGRAAGTVVSRRLPLRNGKCESFEYIKVERVERVGVATLNRPKALNALCSPLIAELGEALADFDRDSSIGCIVVTGSERAFAAGADIKEMSELKFIEAHQRNIFKAWESVSTVRKPVVAAVSGYALGGGCELAMMCDFILASSTAKFGQPEITLGTIPGVGGTQRLIRAVGKSKAMDMILSGDMMGADEAKQYGLVSRVFPTESFMDDVMKVAKKISSFSKPVLALAKDCVNAAYETNLQQGLDYERKCFQSTFALKDQKEGMAAFVEKREPAFTDN